MATSYGFHIIKMDERQEKRTAPFAEARDFIYSKLKAEQEQKKAQEFVEQAVKDAGMEVYGEKAAAAPADRLKRIRAPATAGEIKK